MYSNSGLFRRKPAARSGSAAKPRWAWWISTTVVVGCLLAYLRHVGLRLAAAAVPLTPNDGTHEAPRPGGRPPGGLPSAQQQPASNPLVFSNNNTAAAPGKGVAYPPLQLPTKPGAPQRVQPGSDAQPLAPSVPHGGVRGAVRPSFDSLGGDGAKEALAVLVKKPLLALIFTMDSITEYVANSKSGGPAGEIIIRESLEWGLRELGVEPVVATSDAEFAALTATPDAYDLIFLDPWTFVSPGEAGAYIHRKPHLGDLALRAVS